MDNGTLVETFKYLNYMHLAKSSLVSKRFWNLIRTHRHKFALLYVSWITMKRIPEVNPVLITDLPAFISIFYKSLSAEEYNKWVIHNQYSRQIPFKSQTARYQRTQNSGKFYHMMAFADHNAEGMSNFHNTDLNHVIAVDRMTVFNAHAKLIHENWPLFQHFVRLITDPFIYVGRMELTHRNDVLNLCRGSWISEAMSTKMSSLLNLS